jgi:hypothetical protein
MSIQKYIPQPGDVIRYVKDGVTWIRYVRGVEDRADFGFYRLFTDKPHDSE